MDVSLQHEDKLRMKTYSLKYIYIYIYIYILQLWHNMTDIFKRKYNFFSGSQKSFIKLAFRDPLIGCCNGKNLFYGNSASSRSISPQYENKHCSVLHVSKQHLRNVVPETTWRKRARDNQCSLFSRLVSYSLDHRWRVSLREVTQRNTGSTAAFRPRSRIFVRFRKKGAWWLAASKHVGAVLIHTYDACCCSFRHFPNKICCTFGFQTFNRYLFC
jgi:hypothetical protein